MIHVYNSVALQIPAGGVVPGGHILNLIYRRTYRPKDATA